MSNQNIFNLSGKVALITGASSGLGKHFAQTLSEAGAEVILAARRTEKLESLQKQLIGKSLIINLDVNSKESVNNLVDKITEINLDIHILVNNAVISDP